MRTVFLYVEYVEKLAVSLPCTAIICLLLHAKHSYFILLIKINAKLSLVISSDNSTVFCHYHPVLDQKGPSNERGLFLQC